MKKRLEKSSRDKAIYGVCGGIAEYYGVSSFIVRLLFLFLGFPLLFVVYILLAYLLPEDSSV